MQVSYSQSSDDITVTPETLNLTIRPSTPPPCPSLLTGPWASHDDLLAGGRVRGLRWQYEGQQGCRCGMTGYRLWQRPPRGVLVSLGFPLPLPASRTRRGQHRVG